MSPDLKFGLYFELRIPDDLGGPPWEHGTLTPATEAFWIIFDFLKSSWFEEDARTFIYFRITRQCRSGALKWKTRDFAMVFEQGDEVVGEALHLFWVAQNVICRWNFHTGWSYPTSRHSFWRSGLWTSPECLPGDIRETFDANNDYGLIPHHQRFHTTLSDHKW